MYANKNPSGGDETTEFINEQVIMNNYISPPSQTQTLGIDVYIPSGQDVDVANTVLFLPLQFKVEGL